MVVTTEVGKVQLAELVKQVQAGNEILLTEDDKPVARLVAAYPAQSGNGRELHIHSLSGHRVLTPIISQADLAEDLFDQQ